MDALSAVQNTSSKSAGTNGFSALSSDEFSKIIFSELSHQDPLAPNDTNALLQQISTLRSIQSDTDLSDHLGNLVSQNQFASAATLIGKRVGGVSENNGRVEDTVTGVTRTSQGPLLTLAGGAQIRMTNLDQVFGVDGGGR